MDNKIILSAMYDKVLEEMEPNEEYKRIMRKFDKERQRFLKNIKSQNSMTLERLCSIIYEANDELNEQLFEAGFSLAIKLFVETIYK